MPFSSQDGFKNKLYNLEYQYNEVKRILKLFITKSPQPVRIGLWAFQRLFNVIGVYMMPLMFARKAYDTWVKKSRVLFRAVLIN